MHKVATKEGKYFPKEVDLKLSGIVCTAVSMFDFCILSAALQPPASPRDRVAQRYAYQYKKERTEARPYSQRAKVRDSEHGAWGMCSGKASKPQAVCMQVVL